MSAAILFYGLGVLDLVGLMAAAGAHVFSAGHDVRELPTNGRDPLTYNDPLRQLVRAIQLVMRTA